MLSLYNLSISVFRFLLWIFAPLNQKANAWLKGQGEVFLAPKNKNFKTIWFHFPSLGEFEQGRTVLEEVKKRYPEKKIIITFFSPSGYEIHKNHPLAAKVFYLPIDTATHAKRFIQQINPEIAIFTKYDFWYHYFNELRKNDIPLYLISAFFWDTQSFFKWYGSLQRKMLSMITKIFVQDDNSKKILNAIGILNVTVSGDTRLDRVAENASKPKSLPFIEEFCANSMVFIAGSTWEPDEKLISNLISDFPHWKFIIAPHDISEPRISELQTFFPNAIKYSTKDEEINSKENRLLIIDNIGLLSSLYQYTDIAYIGGGFGKGIHNTLEAAVFEQPILFGPNYKKFPEAKALIAKKAAFCIKDGSDLKTIMEYLQDTETRKKAGETAGKFVRENTGATDIIMEHLFPINGI